MKGNSRDALGGACAERMAGRPRPLAARGLPSLAQQQPARLDVQCWTRIHHLDKSA